MAASGRWKSGCLGKSWVWMVLWDWAWNGGGVGGRSFGRSRKGVGEGGGMVVGEGIENGACRREEAEEVEEV